MRHYGIALSLLVLITLLLTSCDVTVSLWVPRVWHVVVY